MTDLMTLQEYLTPDPRIRGPRPCPEFMPDAPESFTSREMSLHSAISVHGYTFIAGRKLWYESVLERCCMLLARLRSDVVEIAEQPPAVAYVDDTGRKRSHIFDFKFTTTSVGRVLTAVKPSARIAKTGIDRTVQLIAEQISPSLADSVVLFTEHKLSQVDLFNAEAVHTALDEPWPEDDAALAKTLRKLKGEATIGDLAETSGLGGYGYDAVVRAIHAGHLRLVEYRKLEFDAPVTRVPARKG